MKWIYLPFAFRSMFVEMNIDNLIHIKKKKDNTHMCCEVTCRDPQGT
ncbi:unnamed protein product [Arabidopsis halleri]